MKSYDKDHAMSFVTTRSGRRVYLDGTPNEFDLLDIANGLNHQYRYKCATTRPYSVLQHSMWLSAELPERLCRAALLHDAAEAFLGDLPAPVRKYVKGFEELEARLQYEISVQFKTFISDIREVEFLERGVYLRAEAELLLVDSEWAQSIACDPIELEGAKERLSDFLNSTHTFMKVGW